MVKAAGVDPGTGSMDILGFDEDGMKVILDVAIPRTEVTRNPSIIIRILEQSHKVHRLDAIVTPSGYGMPLKRAQEAEDWEIREATFIHCDDYRRRLQIVGLRELMFRFRESGLPAWFTPGGVHLPTIPYYRKSNKIDMGTADKIFTIAASLAREKDEFGVEPGDIDIIVIEAGKAYNSVMLVSGGELVDAIAGTAGFWGFMGAGHMDSELAYALAAVKPRFSKALLFRGGVSTLTGIGDLQELADRLQAGDTRALLAVRILSESITKAVAALAIANNVRPRRVYVSGRIFRVDPIASHIVTELRKTARHLPGTPKVVRPMRLGLKTKEAATGAALIANGLAGGKYSWIVDSLRLREAKGSIFDTVSNDLAEELKQYFHKECPGEPFA
ncbi:MAG: DUF1464 family protein [Desulfurococcales archaeon]|nr:DUF1464 family protein [Desulfurococcales archaeon]